MSLPEQREPKEVQRFGQDVLRAALVDLTSKALLYVGGSLGAAFVLLVVFGGSIPAWVLAAVLLVVIVMAVLARRQIGRLRRDLEQRDVRITQLEPLEAQVPQLEEDRDRFGFALDRYDVYTAHLAEVLDHLQRVVAGEIEADIPTYIERGILEPARDVLTDDPEEHIRLSVLLPDGDDQCFVMVWAAGHTLRGLTKYRVPIKDTLSRLAYEDGEVHDWPDTAEDDRFTQNPEASHPTRCMVSIPLRNGDDTIGVFNTVAARPDVFDLAETRYLTSLGSVISVAVSIHLERDSGESN